MFIDHEKSFFHKLASFYSSSLIGLGRKTAYCTAAAAAVIATPIAKHSILSSAILYISSNEATRNQNQFHGLSILKCGLAPPKGWTLWPFNGLIGIIDRGYLNGFLKAGFFFRLKLVYFFINHFPILSFFSWNMGANTGLHADLPTEIFMILEPQNQ